MKKYIAFFLILSFFISCNFNANVAYENQESDKSDAQAIAGFLYLYTANKSYDSILDLMSDEFYKTTSKDNLIAFLKNKESKLGDYKDMELIDWKTVDIKGSNSRTEYLLIYKITYSKCQAEEKISLIKESNKTKILGYNVNEKMDSVTN